MIKTLTLGYAGEYGARMMTIDLSEEAAMWPDAAAQLLLVRPGEHTPYPADNAVYADGCMTFTPTKADMAITGQGHAQVYFYGADGNVLGKSSMMITHILNSLGGDSTEPPSGEELGYYDKLMQQAALAIAAGESAKEDAQSAAESAAKAEAALEEMKNISTQSGNMPDGGSPGQILAKKSAENYDAHWIDPPSGSGTGGGVADSVAWDNVTDKPSTYPPAAHTHPEYLGKNETAANATQLNGKSAEYYTNPRNMLVNSNFQEIDEIINQRGYVSGTNGASNYCIDHWKLQYETALQLNNGYVTLTGLYDVCQIVSKKLRAGVTYTFAARMRASNGTRPLWLIAEDSAGNRITYATAQNSGEWVVMTCLITLNADMSDLNVYITNSGDANVHTDIAWVALYEGTYTADNLPPYVAPDPALELAKCLGYRRQSFEGNTVPGYSEGAVVVRAANQNYLCSVNFDSPMIGKPTVMIYSPATKAEGAVLIWSNDEDISGVSVHTSSTGFVVYKSGAFDMNEAYTFHYIATCEP